MKDLNSATVEYLGASTSCCMVLVLVVLFLRNQNKHHQPMCDLFGKVLFVCCATWLVATVHLIDLTKESRVYKKSYLIYIDRKLERMKMTKL